MKYVLIKNVKKAKYIYARASMFGKCKYKNNKAMCMIPEWLFDNIINNHYIYAISEQKYVKGW